MTEPLAAAICLTRDRPAMLRRAVESFRAKTYPLKRLFIFDTSVDEPNPIHTNTEERFWAPYRRELTIGALRNEAIQYAKSWVGIAHQEIDIIVTFDDDDYSSPNRIADQCSLLESSGADAVGYSELLFWREDMCEPWRTVNCECGESYPRSGAPCPKCHTYPNGEAWLYRKPKLVPPPGTTLAFWRKTWERKPFPDAPRGPQATGEDYLWCQGLNVVSAPMGIEINPQGQALREPMIIASIHSGNSSKAYDIENKIAGGSREWQRVEAWDNWARGRMRL